MNDIEKNRLLKIMSANGGQLAAIDRVLDGRLEPPPRAPEPPRGPLLLQVKDAAALLGVHRATIWRLVKAGRLDTVELLGSQRIRRADVEALAGGHQAAGKVARRRASVVGSTDAGGE
jgi:excisionase family DNA binding protein